MSIKTSGSQLTVIGTEHTLATLKTSAAGGSDAAGDYLFGANLTPMLTGDSVELRVKRRVISAGVAVGFLYELFSNAQSADDCAKSSDPVRLELELVFTLKQTAGSPRTFEWAIDRCDS